MSSDMRPLESPPVPRRSWNCTVIDASAAQLDVQTFGRRCGSRYRRLQSCENAEPDLTGVTRMSTATPQSTELPAPTAITNLLSRYAELIDNGEFEAIGELFAHATVTADN